MLLQHSRTQQRLNRQHRQHQSLNKQRGVVIVVALFIVALVATMAYVMIERLERDTRRTMLIIRDNQADLYAQGSVLWAVDQLRNNWEKQKPKQPIDRTPIVSPIKNENGYQIVSTIYDMQARYNLNNLNAPEAQADFKRMLRTVMPTLTDQQAQQISRAIGTVVMRKALQSMSELRLVNGVTSNIYNALRPYVTALPAGTKINVKSAPAPVIMTLSPSMTLESAKIVEQLCRANPPVSPEAFTSLDIIRNHPVDPGKIVVTSAFFLVETEVTIEKQRLVLYTLLERVTDAKKATVNIVWQSKGIW